jgi:hypothetical protein
MSVMMALERRISHGLDLEVSELTREPIAAVEQELASDA